MAVYYWDVYGVNLYNTKVYTQCDWSITNISSSKPVYIGTGYRFNLLNGTYRLTGYKKYSAAGEYPTYTSATINTYQQNTMYYCPDGIYGTATQIYPLDPDNAGIYTSVPDAVQGDLISQVSSDEMTAYPENGTNDETNWYVLRGAPDSISYPKYIYPGDPISITWSQGINPVYYTLERSIDGGASWEVLSQTLEDTSYTDNTGSLTGAQSIIYRICTVGENVQSEYTQGAVLTVSQTGARVKLDGTWKNVCAVFLKSNSSWEKLADASENNVITAESKYRIEKIQQ